jgi:thiamine kinase-like enzyme
MPEITLHQLEVCLYHIRQWIKELEDARTNVERLMNEMKSQYHECYKFEIITEHTMLLVDSMKNDVLVHCDTLIKNLMWEYWRYKESKQVADKLINL